ncbi:hypothetical protein [Chryseolinea soli]|uniref:Lipoprotein n=1 Tax=Chryseolinea soli TaxID=2321403 RepID=A0A385SSH3_9BACT|nr:hypothetical protein [Chryseolinea soli]AYB33842.1 hypothetical protein D4L85_26130 [Chryseolinea soli]
MKLLRISLLALAALTFGACHDNDDKHGRDLLSASDAYFSFGSFYGMCQGENCVAFFLVRNGKLYEDKKDQYPKNGTPHEGDYEALSDEKYQLVKDLVNKIPQELLSESSTTIGCPDCADGGGTYIEINSADGKRFWYIDNNNRETPEYLHDFIEEVNEKINQLR